MKKEQRFLVTEPKDWEKELGELLNTWYRQGQAYVKRPQSVQLKSFISQLLEKERESIVKEVKKLRKIGMGEETHCGVCGGHFAAGECGCDSYNSALDDVLTAFKNK